MHWMRRLALCPSAKGRRWYCHIEGLSNGEIAQILDITIEAVESLTARGKRA